MSSEPLSGGASGRYTSLSLQEEIPWQTHRTHDSLQSSHHLPYNQPQAPINTQLSITSRNSSLLSVGNDDRAGSLNQSSNLNSSGVTSRLLPSRDVSDQTFDDAYVSFIFFCNPSIPFDTDTDELRKAFRSPSKSDGKSFSIFTLFELIRKLELKEIKTWAQLAIELGVEPPAMDKRQSSQKVQQYAVRLKRWMHAMHVDAFFEYLLEKRHPYWTDIPSVNEPSSEFGRDGVPPEEDLALRALLPQTRPKRGRRRAEDKDNDLGRSPAQRPRLHSPTLSEDFAMARTSGYENFTSETPRLEWPAVDSRISFFGRSTISLPQEAPMSQNQQWRGIDANQTPAISYPQSAIIPRTTNPFLSYDSEPQSAITPSSSKSRRRHGPAVSSAWPRNSNVSAGKLRGRPPSNQSVSDGPFSTFPANPNTKTGPPIILQGSTIPTTPMVNKSGVKASTFTYPDAPASGKAPVTKPSKLYLQVPERVSAPIRLATPPPTLLVNGENDTSRSTEMAGNESQDLTPVMDYSSNAIFINPFERNSHFQKKEHTPKNGQKPSNQQFLNDLDFRIESSQDRTNVDEVEFMLMHTVLHAEWVDHKEQSIGKCSLEEADQIVKQVIQNLRDGSNSRESFLINLACLAGGDFLRASAKFLKITRLESEGTTNQFELWWTLKFGSIEETFNLKITVPQKLWRTDNEDRNHQDHSTSSNLEEWKARYMDLHTRLKERDARIKNLKRNVLDALVALDGFGV